MMPFLVISSRGLFSPPKPKKFLSCPGWRWFVLRAWFVLDRGGYRCAKAGLQFQQFPQPTGGMNTKFMHSAFQLCVALLCFLLSLSVPPAAASSRVQPFELFYKDKCQPIVPLLRKAQCGKLSVSVSKCCLSASGVLCCHFSSKQALNVNDIQIIFG